MDFSSVRSRVKEAELYRRMGKIKKIIGTTIESSGPACKIGDVCRIYRKGESSGILAEVVGFKEEGVLLMPYADIEGVGPGSIVDSTGGQLSVNCSEHLVGRIIDAVGQPLDGGMPIPAGVSYSIAGRPVNPLTRPAIKEIIPMGVKAIDGLLTIGRGQRMGIFAGSGVGKSTLLGMIAREVQADINVIALVGERGREVLEFIQRDLGEAGMRRSVLVVATSDQPAMLRSKAPLTATAIAEYFKDQGKNVLLMMDSLTRYAMAQREIGLSVGEAPIARGYTPSIYTTMPRLLERAGNFETGSITGIYTVLVEGDDTNEPISDTVRGIIDGHIILSRKIAMQNHYPAIDVLGSISRLMSEITTKDQQATASKMRNLMSVYEDNFDLVSIGAYKKGSNKRLDEAIGKMDKINQFLVQQVDESVTYEETIARMVGAVAD